MESLIPALSLFFGLWMMIFPKLCSDILRELNKNNPLMSEKFFPFTAPIVFALGVFFTVSGIGFAYLFITAG
jgi:hypothetical protein